MAGLITNVNLHENLHFAIHQERLETSLSTSKFISLDRDLPFETCNLMVKAFDLIVELAVIDS